MFDNLKYDLNRIMENDPAARSKIEVFLVYPSVHALIAYRIAHFLYNKKLFLLARIVSQLSKIGRAHVWTPVTSLDLVCRLLLEKKKK